LMDLRFHVLHCDIKMAQSLYDWPSNVVIVTVDPYTCMNFVLSKFFIMMAGRCYLGKLPMQTDNFVPLYTGECGRHC
jgi:hypothetical protein